MPLEITVADITARLRQGRFPNEQAISQGIVLRVLQELGWDTLFSGNSRSQMLLSSNAAPSIRTHRVASDAISPARRKNSTPTAKIYAKCANPYPAAGWSQPT